MSTYSHVSYERSFSDFFSSYQIDRVLQIINDTSLAQGRNNLRFSLNNNVTLKNARLSAGGQIDQTEGLILSGGIPAIFKSVAWLLRSTLDASFGKGYFLKINAEHHRSNNRYPEQLAGKGSAGSSRSRASVEQRAVIDKVLILTARTEWSRFIMQGRGRGSLFFVDFEVNYKIRNSKWAIRAVGGNLSDERSYYSGYSSALSQTYFEIPLVPRNVFFSVRCEF